MEGMYVGGGEGWRGLQGRVGQGGNWHLHQWSRGGPKEVPRFKLGGAGERYRLVPIGDKNRRVRKGIIAGKHVDQVVPDERRSAGLAHQVDLDEGRSGRKGDWSGAGVLKVVNVVCGTVVGNERGGSVGVVVEKGKLAKEWSGWLVGKRGIRALLEAHPAVPSKKDGVLHSTRRDNTCPHG